MDSVMVISEVSPHVSEGFEPIRFLTDFDLGSVGRHGFHARGHWRDLFRWFRDLGSVGSSGDSRFGLSLCCLTWTYLILRFVSAMLRFNCRLRGPCSAAGILATSFFWRLKRNVSY